MKILILTLILSLNLKAETYPEEWFKPVPTEGAPAWEVLPQDAGPGEVILSKRNELGILSNFAATPFIYRGKKYASVEGFWQMMKYPENVSDPRPQSLFPFTRDQVSSMTAFEAKNAGSIGEKIMLQLGIDWVSFEGQQIEYCSLVPKEHYQIIKEAMWEKLQQNPEVKRIVIATGDLKLRPDHHSEGCLALEWRYYDIWMEFRTLLN
jgi:predicted NAD-dependent protein-ADP-ribosyltransferase YbiA (DUF1768 family)